MAFAFLLGACWTWSLVGLLPGVGLVSACIYLFSSWTPKQNPLAVGSHCQGPLFFMPATLIPNNSIVPGQIRDTVQFQSKAISQRTTGKHVV